MAWVRAFKFLKLEETLPALFDGRITDRNPSSPHLCLPIPSKGVDLDGLQVPKVGGLPPALFGGRITNRNLSSRIIWFAHSK